MNVVTYEGCPHGVPHDEPCPKCIATWEEHRAKQAEAKEREQKERR